MVSRQVDRANRPNAWLLRPMLQTRRKPLPTRSRPHMARLRMMMAFMIEHLSNEGAGLLQSPAHDDRGADAEWRQMACGERAAGVGPSRMLTSEPKRHALEDETPWPAPQKRPLPRGPGHLHADLHRAALCRYLPTIRTSTDCLRQLVRMRSQRYSNHGSATKYHIDAHDQSQCPSYCPRQSGQNNRG